MGSFSRAASCATCLRIRYFLIVSAVTIALIAMSPEGIPLLSWNISHYAAGVITCSGLVIFGIRFARWRHAQARVGANSNTDIT